MFFLQLSNVYLQPEHPSRSLDSYNSYPVAYSILPWMSNKQFRMSRLVLMVSPASPSFLPMSLIRQNIGTVLNQHLHCQQILVSASKCIQNLITLKHCYCSVPRPHFLPHWENLPSWYLCFSFHLLLRGSHCSSLSDYFIIQVKLYYFSAHNPPVSLPFYHK